MPMQLPIALAGLALVTGSIALTVALANRPADAEGSASSAPATPTSNLNQRLEQLEAENRALRDRLAALELRPVGVAREPVEDDRPTAADLEALREELLEAIDPSATATPEQADKANWWSAGKSADRPESAVEQAVTKFESRIERRRDELEATMPKLDELLDLTPDQSERMRNVLLTNYEREAEILRLWEEGVADEVLGEQKSNDRAAFQADLNGVLSVEQVELYLESAGLGGGK